MNDHPCFIGGPQATALSWKFPKRSLLSKHTLLSIASVGVMVAEILAPSSDASVYIATGDAGGMVYEYSDTGTLISSFSAPGVSDLAVNNVTRELILAGAAFGRYELDGTLIQRLTNGFTQTWINNTGAIIGYLPGADGRGYLYYWQPDGSNGTRFASYYKDAAIAAGGQDGRLWVSANAGALYQFSASYAYGGSPGTYATDVTINVATGDVWTFGPDEKLYRFSSTGSKKGEVESGLTDGHLVSAPDGTILVASNANGGVIGRWDASGAFLGFTDNNLGVFQAIGLNNNTGEILAAFSGTIYRFNADGTLISTFGSGLDVLAISTLAIPEPGSVAMMAVGGGLAFWMLRRK